MTPAERTRRYKARRRKGERIFPLPLPEYDLIAALLKSSRLSEQEALDHRKVKAEAAQVMREWIANWQPEKW